MKSERAEVKSFETASIQLHDEELQSLEEYCRETSRNQIDELNLINELS